MTGDLLKKYNVSSLVELLRYRAETQPDKTAYIFLTDGERREARLTYSELEARSRAIAASLRKNENFRPGERALLLYPPGLEFIPAFFGCLRAGVVAVPAYPPNAARPDANSAKLRMIIADCEPENILSAYEFLNSAQSVFPHCPELEETGWLLTDNINLALAGNWTDAETDPDAPALLQYTSGSTGDPKGVMVSHENLTRNLEVIRRAFGHDELSKGAGWLPAHHDMGLITQTILPLYVGQAGPVMSPLDFLRKPALWLRAVSEYKATHSGGPNFAYDLCVDKITPEQLGDLDLGSWEVAFSGAEPVRAETMDRFVEKFAKCGFKPEAFSPCYGMAEATLIISGKAKGEFPAVVHLDKEALKKNRAIFRDAGAEGARPIVGCGKAWLGHKIAIVDPETETRLFDGQVGEIWVSGPSVAQGYWNKPDKTEKIFRASLSDTGEGPFLRTEDLGFLKDGELFVTGRLKDIIIIRGRNYYPQDIELAAETSHPGLRSNCSVVFSVEEDNEERLIVVQELTSEYLSRLYSSTSGQISGNWKNVNADEAIGAIRKAISEEHEVQVCAIVLVASGIPRTSSGKLKRKACKEMFLEGRLSAVAEWRLDPRKRDAPELLPSNRQTSKTIQDWITAAVSRESGIPARDIDIRQEFSAYGLDSVQIVSLVGELEEWLGISLSPTLIYNYPDIRKLSLYLSGEHEEGKTDERRSRVRDSSEPVAIVGMSCRFPKADSPDEFWRMLEQGVDAVGEVPDNLWKTDDFHNRDSESGKTSASRGGFLERSIVENFDVDFFGISRLEAESMDPQQRLLLETSWEALENAGLAPDKLGESKTGVFVGVCGNDYFYLRQKSASHSVNAYVGIGNALSIVANRLSWFLDLRGPSVAIDTACSSSLVAVHQACQSLIAGECDLALAGGVNLILDPYFTAMFSQAGMLSSDGRCKTFDAAADGYVRGEGCGVIALKRLSDALEDKDGILAVIKGSAVNQDGRSNGLTAPNGNSQQAVIREALKNANAMPWEIGFAETHGTGTALGDPIEVESLKAVLGQGRRSNQLCRLGAVKSNIGHLEGASGIAGLIKTALCLRHKKIPPNLHFRKLNPLISIGETPFAIPTELKEWPAEKGLIKGSETPRLAGVSSFGFGGTNAHVILEEAPEAKTETLAPESSFHLLTLSAKTERALVDLSVKYADFLESHPEIPLADICFSANVGRSRFDHRAAIAASSVPKLREGLTAFARGEPGDLTASMETQGYEIFVKRGTQAIPSAMEKQCLSKDEGLRSAGKNRLRTLRGLGYLYARGGSVDWTDFYSGEPARKVVLPTYPWQKKRYWMNTTEAEPQKDESSSTTPIVSLLNSGDIEQLIRQLKPEPETISKDAKEILELLAKQQRRQLTAANIKNWLYRTNWTPQAKKKAEPLIKAEPKRWLILADRSGIGRKLAELLKERSQVRALAFKGESYKQINDYEFTVNPRNPDDFELLFARLNQGAGKTSDKSPVCSIAHLWSVDAPTAENVTSEDLNAASVNGCLSVLHLTQALLKAEFSKPPCLWLVTQNSQAVDLDSNAETERPALSIAQSPLWGMGRVIAFEHPELLAGMIDLDFGDYAAIAENLLDEIENPDNEDHIAFRNGRRYAARLEQARSYAGSETISFERDASYLITGGFGGLGLKVARWLADQGAGHLALSSRRGFADYSAAARETVARMRNDGVEVVAFRTDVSERTAVKEMMETIRSSLPPLKGIVHCAGLIDDGILEQLSAERFAKVIAPKIQGTWNLHSMSKDSPLDFFVCFSSLASMLGAPGQANYAAANAFMDSLAFYRRSLGLPGTSINWGPWAEVGLAAGLNAAGQARLSRVMKSIAPEQGLLVMEQILSMDVAQVGVVSMNWSNYLQLFSSNKHSLLVSLKNQLQVKTERKKQSGILRKLKDVSADERLEIMTSYLQTEMGKAIGYESSQLPDPREKFFEMGMDSLMAVELRNMLAIDLDVSLPATLFITLPNIEELAPYLIKKMRAGKSDSVISEEEINRKINDELAELEKLI